MASGSTTGSVASSLSFSLQTIIDRARRKLDNYEEPYLWTDQEMVDYANETIQTIHYETGYLNDTSTASIVTISLLDGVRSYTLSGKIVRIKRAIISSSSAELTKTTVDELSKSNPTWESDDEGEPTKYMLDYDSGVLTVYPTPDTAYTLNLDVVRYNATDFTTASMSGQTPELPVRYIDTMVNGVVFLACMKSGPDTYRSQQAKEYFALFNNGLARMKRDMIRFFGKTTYQKPHNGWM